ncbi:MAG TPA: NUDIX domain-containing protein, partial [Phenylobacterium sp.]|nr:NUDIX domain-containing protein [Phenylobacterium sp.]
SKWALPGGFLQESDEDLDACASRELREETGISAKYLKHFRNFSAKDRDPRWVVSAAYFALIPWEELHPSAGSDAAAIKWFPVRALPELAFDHSDILREANEALKANVDGPKGILMLLGLVPRHFTLTELQIVHHAVCGHGTNPEDLRKRKAHFRKTILNSEKVEVVRGKFRMSSNRPAQLYKISEIIESKIWGKY